MSKLELQEVPLSSAADDENDGPRSLEQLEEEALEAIDVKRMEMQLEAMEEQIAQSRPNLAVIQEYRKKVRYCLTDISVKTILLLVVP